jgi:hypothetical protein
MNPPCGSRSGELTAVLLECSGLSRISRVVRPHCGSLDLSVLLGGGGACRKGDFRDGRLGYLLGSEPYNLTMHHILTNAQEPGDLAHRMAASAKTTHARGGFRWKCGAATKLHATALGCCPSGRSPLSDQRPLILSEGAPDVEEEATHRRTHRARHPGK